MYTPVSVGLTTWLAVAVLPSLTAASADRDWWLDPQRLLQTNLREIDATMDLDRCVEEVKKIEDGCVRILVPELAHYDALRVEYR